VAKKDADILRNVAHHLNAAEDALANAVAEFGPRAGGLRYFLGSVADYKKMVGTMLRVRYIKSRISRAVARTESEGGNNG